MTKTMQLQAQRGELVAKAQALIEGAEAENRDFSDDEQTKYDAVKNEIAAIDTRIARQKEADAFARAQPAASVHVTAHERIEDDPRRGFNSFGQFASAVKQAATGNAFDDRLKIGAALSTYGNESSGADGGYLVPPEFSSSVYQHSLEEQAFLPLTDLDPVSGNGMSFPADETTPWGATGVQAYWTGEAASATQSKPAVKLRNLRLNKLTALVPMTDELMEDTATLDGYITRKTGEAIRWKTNDAIINGTGAGQPAGIFNAAALVSQAKESSQTADTINANNIAKMYARNLNPGRAYWLINPDAFAQLPLMTLGDQPVYIPPMGLSQAPYGMLMGRPVILTDVCQTLGDKGDIYFIDFQGVKSITKAGGINTATSMHLWFDQGVTAFRATFRVDAQPWLSSAVTPPNSSVTRSPFVTLNARA